MTQSRKAPDTTFDVVVDWPLMSAEAAESIRRFWLDEKAITDDAKVSSRMAQVVMHACTPDGEVAGVCTALVATPPTLAQPVYFWRAFIGARWRSTTLVRTLLNRSCALLGEHARANDYPCIGILLELENPRFNATVRLANWRHPDFTYIGRSRRGLDLRVHYFKGARLKSATSP